MYSDFSFEYEYDQIPDSEEQLSHVYDIIFALLLEDYELEQQANSESEPC